MTYSTNEMLFILYNNKRDKLIKVVEDLLSDGLDIPLGIKSELEHLDDKINSILRFNNYGKQRKDTVKDSK